MLKIQIIHTLIVRFFWSMYIARAFMQASMTPATPVYKHEKLAQIDRYEPINSQNVRHSLQLNGL